MPTVIGTFDDRARADQAVQRLVQSGFDRNSVQIQQQAPQDQPAQTEPSQGPGHQMVDGVQDDLRHVSNTWDANKAEHQSQGGSFFARLFGRDDQVDNRQQSHSQEHAHACDEALRRGSAIVVVEAQDATQADRANSLLQECGAYDLDERAKQWKAEGWTPLEPRQPYDPADDGASDSSANPPGVLDVNTSR